MSQPRLHHKIFRLVGGFLFGTLVVVLISVWSTTRQYAKEQAETDLDVAINVLTNVLDTSEKQLFSAAKILTSDFGFRQSVATEDQNTISSVLDNHGRRIEADLMVVTDLSGKIVSSNSDSFDPAVSFLEKKLIDEVLSADGVSLFIQFNGEIYQLILLTIDAPAPIAIAAVGFSIDKSFAEELKNIVKLDVSFVLTSNEKRSIVSTLPVQNSLNLLPILNPLSQTSNTNLKSMIVAKLNLYRSADSSIDVILIQDLEKKYSEFLGLQINISVIALLSIAIAFILVVFYSRNLTRPLQSLSSIAKEIAAGRYENNIDNSRSFLEIDELSKSFDSMRLNIQERENKIQFQADHDLLTQLHNRFWVSEYLQKKMIDREVFQLFAFSVMNLREINDTFGYQNGDQYLQTLAARINELGGESAYLNNGEVLWIPDSLIDSQVVQKTRLDLEQEVLVESFIINANIAISELQFPDDADSIEAIFRRLGVTIDAAKREPNNYHAYSRELEEQYLLRLSTISELKQALTKNQHELAVHYQPKMDLMSGSITGAEALIRWNNKKLGNVYPDYFIPLAEQSDLVSSITRHVIRCVIADISDWREHQMELTVAINISSRDISDVDLLPWVIEKLQAANLPPTCLDFEITEGQMIKDPEKAIYSLRKMRDSGFGIAVDDFGTGYSSLAYLKSLPVQFLKIDKSFILELESNLEDQEIVQITITLAHRLGLKVIAEGVETKASLELLKKWECESIQGYYISKALPPEAFIKWYNEFRN